MNRKVLKGIEVAAYIIAALSFFYFFYILVCDINGFKHLSYLMPMVVTLILPVYFLFILHLLLYPINFKKYHQTLLVNGYVMAALALVGAILIPCYVGMDIYHGMVQGIVSPLFPLDFFIYDLIMLGLGIYLVIRAHKIKEEDPRLYFPYGHKKVRKVFDSIFRGFYIILALYLTGAFLVGFYIADYGDSYLWNLIPMFLLIIIQNVILAYYEFFYHDARQDYKKRLEAFRFSYIAFIATGVCSIAFIIVLAVNPYIMTYPATAYFPADFMGSVNVAPYMCILPPLCASLVATLSLLPRKKETK